MHIYNVLTPFNFYHSFQLLRQIFKLIKIIAPVQDVPTAAKPTAGKSKYKPPPLAETDDPARKRLLAEFLGCKHLNFNYTVLIILF